MELDEFSKLLSCGSANTAKNTLSYLIGNGLNNNNWSVALAELYKSFPAEIKTSVEDKKEFFPVILKYFSIHQLTKNNISIYKEYESLFSAKNRDDLKNKNPQWIWDSEPEVVFKNALAFTNAIPYNSSESKFSFIKKYENQFVSLAKNQKDKLFKHFASHNIWRGLIRENYSQFVLLCDTYGFDRIDILKDTITKFTNIYSENLFNSENMEYYVDDLLKIGKQNFNIDNFYPTSQYHIEQKSHTCSVFSVLLDSIIDNKYQGSFKWMLAFSDELNDYAKLYGVDNLNSSKNFKLLLKKQIDLIKESAKQSRGNLTISYFYEIETVLKNENWFKFMDSIELNEKLTEKLEPKLKTKLPKI